jgi:signal recognition particle receptor subunit beta
MVELNHRDRTIKVKIVYYGPPVGGKTTNLQILHRMADVRRRGEMISVNSAQDRTILFDLLPLKTPGFRGFDIRLQVLAVPGQAMYAATRRLVLKGADSLVFVANSALDRWEENIQSYREMTSNLLSHHLEPSQMPLVFQYNKRDLPQVLEMEALDRALNARHAETLPAVAVRGEGVLETFSAILAHTVQDLAKRYAILDVKGGAPARQWADESVRQLFGTNKLRLDPEQFAHEPAPPSLPPVTATVVTPPRPAPAPRDAVASGPDGDAESPSVLPVAEEPATVSSEVPSLVPRTPVPPPGYTIVRVAPPPPADDAPRPSPSSPEGRAAELVETYAEASAQLGAALTELREERDTARQRLEDLGRTLEASQEILSGTPFDTALAPVLATMARVAGSEHAAFWVPQPGQPPRAAALLALESDPVLGSPAALRHVMEAALHGPRPSFAMASDGAELATALETPQRRFAGVLALPFRTPGGLQGLAAFYYGADTARPGSGALDQLTEFPRALAAALELAATLRTVKAAERALELALAGSASLRGLEGVVRSLERLRDGLGEIRNRPDAPPWFQEQYVRLAPALGSALEDGRSLLGFSRGEVRRESVYLEDLLAELRTPDVTVDLDPAAETITADATLLRVALRAIADEVRARAGGNTAPLAIHAGVWTDGVRIAVRALGPPAEASSTPSVNAGLGLGLARRIAELHEGALEDDGPGAAGEVVLTLPAA